MIIITKNRVHKKFTTYLNFFKNITKDIMNEITLYLTNRCNGAFRIY